MRSWMRTTTPTAGMGWRSEVFGLEWLGRMRGLEPSPAHRPRTNARAREPAL